MDNEPLKGIRVIDLSRILAGPYCTMLLGDMGAEVFKVEQPGSGDGSRQWGPPWIGSESAYYLSVNRNKKSLTLNLKNPEAQDILRQLIDHADIVVENFKPGTLRKLKLDFESLSINRPELIYCSITGYGQDGPYRDRPGFDFMIQAQGGIMSVTGPVEGPPYKVGVAILDISAGLHAAIAILAALYHREQTGLGQYIDIALLDTQVSWLVNVAHNYFATGLKPERFGNAHPNIVPYEIFPTQDSHLALAIGTDGQYQLFCKVVDRPDLWNDERFQTNASRVEHRQTLIPLLQKLFREKPTSAWVDLLTQSGIPAGPINDIPTIMNDPQILSRQMVQTVEHPTLGIIDQLGHVAKFSATPATIRLAPPLLGEHTESVLREELGLSNTDLTRLRQEGAI
ncbi:MAG: CoA transferase [Anaerolineales bacterium]|nr:CoA transferase [Anaerolineales bacterium]